MVVQIVDIGGFVDHHFLFITISPLQLCLARAYVAFVSKKNVDGIRDSPSNLLLLSSRRTSPINSTWVKIKKSTKQK